MSDPMATRAVAVLCAASAAALIAAVVGLFPAVARAGEYRAQVCHDGLVIGDDGRLSYSETRDAFRRSNDCDGPAADGARVAFGDRGSVRSGGYAQWVARENVTELTAQSIRARPRQVARRLLGAGPRIPFGAGSASRARARQA